MYSHHDSLNRYSIIHGKSGVKYAGVEIEALRSVAEAHKKRSLKMFQEMLTKYAPQLTGDSIIASHINGLYEKLLEQVSRKWCACLSNASLRNVQNLIRILDPFSVVQIAHVAKLIDLPIERVQGMLRFGHAVKRD